MDPVEYSESMDSKKNQCSMWMLHIRLRTACARDHNEKVQYMTKRTIILVGSNPSTTSPNNAPFDSSVKSAKTLKTWIEGIDADFLFMNVSDAKTQANKPLSAAQIKDSIPSLKEKLDRYPTARVVALGKTAEKALSILNIRFLALPHPSGMNRMLNDPETVRLTKENLKSFSSGYNSITDAM